MKNDDSKRYLRQTLGERGHFSNYFSLFPVKEIQVDDKGVMIKRRSKCNRYQWSEIKEVRLIYRKKYKPYGAGTGGYIKQRLCVVVAPDFQYKFDLSGQFPDFKDSVSLLKIFSEKVKVVEMHHL